MPIEWLPPEILVPDDYLIPPAGNEPDTGKTLSALRKSRDGHSAMLALFGGTELLPSSVMRHRREPADAAADGAIVSGRRYDDSLPPANAAGMKHRDGGIRSMHRKNQGSLNGALSRFPQAVGRTVVLFYTEPGDHVVDPFAGHNSRMSLVVRAGRDYTGCDVSAEFMAHNRTHAAALRREYPNRTIVLHETDSRRQPVASGVGDFTITSPPYYDIEDYGDEPAQLGKCKTYADFLDGMQEVVDENYRTLKPGAFSCWFINDFRRGGKLHFYHMDVKQLGERAGFVAWDIMVVDLGRCIRDGFVNEAVRCKVLPKRHEYMIVFRKPGWK